MTEAFPPHHLPPSPTMSLQLSLRVKIPSEPLSYFCGHPCFPRWVGRSPVNHSKSLGISAALGFGSFASCMLSFLNKAFCLIDGPVQPLHVTTSQGEEQRCSPTQPERSRLGAELSPAQPPPTAQRHWKDPLPGDGVRSQRSRPGRALCSPCPQVRAPLLWPHCETCWGSEGPGYIKRPFCF